MRLPTQKEWNELDGSQTPEELWFARWNYSLASLGDVLFDAQFEPLEVLALAKAISDYIDPSSYLSYNRGMDSIAVKRFVPVVILDGSQYTIMTPLQHPLDPNPDPLAHRSWQAQQLPPHRRMWQIGFAEKPVRDSGITVLSPITIPNNEQ